jgi:outer membrane immunogenic protein
MPRIHALFVLFTILLLSLPSPAKADGYDWTGFYAGINSGVAVGDADVDATVPWVGAPGDWFVSCFSCARAINVVGKRTIEDVGYTGGGQLGFDYQVGMLVAGLETDFQYFHLKDTDRLDQPYPPYAPAGAHIENVLDTDWLYTARGKLGVAMDRLLIFGSGGLALTDLSDHFRFNDDFGGIEKGSINSTKLGWAAGGGLEFALMDNVSVRAEYLHVDFGKESQRENTFHNPTGPYPLTRMKHSIDLDAEIGRVALNYRF